MKKKRRVLNLNFQKEEITLFLGASKSIYNNTTDHMPSSLAAMSNCNAFQLQIVAFGPSTKTELERRGYNVHRTLEKPTPQGLVDAIGT